MKARFYIDVEFDGRETDAESMASAMDNVVKCGMTVVGDCWEEYGGKPKVGECSVLDTRHAAEHAGILELLVDARKDDLGEMLVSIRDFLKEVAGKAGSCRIAIVQQAIDGLTEY